MPGAGRQSICAVSELLPHSEGRGAERPEGSRAVRRWLGVPSLLTGTARGREGLTRGRC